MRPQCLPFLFELSVLSHHHQEYLWGAPMDLYRHKCWKDFRSEVIEADGSACVRCGKKASAGAILQVHHKVYVAHKKPWEYKLEDCETLCKGCHAKEHGIIVPTFGWKLIGFDDLGVLDGTCDYCGNELRYTYLIEHEKWPTLVVGETCCDHLTSTSIASNHLDSYKRYEQRKQRFIDSTRWVRDKQGNFQIKQRGFSADIIEFEGSWRIIVNNVKGKKRFENVKKAMVDLFDQIENGKISEFFSKRV